MSNVGKWDEWYANIKDPEAYGNTVTYKLGSEYLQDCDVVEDWGCGKGWFRNLCEGRYVGIDGSHTPFADKVVDLTEYRSEVEGIFMRHVIEHNRDWKTVLDNAIASFTERMCLVLFTPFSEETHQIGYVAEVDVPDMSFSKDDLIKCFEDAGVVWKLQENIPSETAYGVEHVFYLAK